MNNKNKTIKQYVSQYIKESLIITLILSVSLSLLFFVISLMYDVVTNDLLISLFPILCEVVFLGLIYVRTLRFMNMIHDQERILNACFTDDLLEPLYPKTLFYCSKSWFIKAGCWAFHRGYLLKITVHVVHEKTRARGYIVEFQTTDGKRITERNMHSGEIKKLQEWYKQ